jgi:pyruvate dehydrogenase E1 component beta subunit
MAEKRFGMALNQALGECMEADPGVIVLGEDIAAAGGSFKVTRGLLDRFGPERVLDTPISEAGIIGAAVGAAMTSLRPVVEIMFMDFITLAMDAIVNQAAKARFMFGGQFSVPMVVRTPHGGGLNAGPQHSQCLEAWLAHVPGLKVVCPSTPADAYTLLKAAIADPDRSFIGARRCTDAGRGSGGASSTRSGGRIARNRTSSSYGLSPHGYPRRILRARIGGWWTSVPAAGTRKRLPFGGEPTAS